MNEPTTNADVPPLGRLLKTTAIALVVAAVLLVLFVLPAEYGIDPTGVGGVLGIDGLAGKTGGGEVIAAAPTGSSLISAEGPRSERLEIAVAPGEEMELKLVMQEGQTVVFSWKATGGALYSDLHADPFGGFEGEDVRYQEDASIEESHGAIVAPFGGNHGWFWRNDSAESVTVTLDLYGFFGVTKEMRADSLR